MSLNVILATARLIWVLTVLDLWSEQNDGLDSLYTSTVRKIFDVTVGTHRGRAADVLKCLTETLRSLESVASGK